MCPAGMQAASLDIQNAYHNSPIALHHKAYIAVMWLGEIYIEHCAVFSLVTSGGIQGTVADAAMAIFLFHGMSHIVKWVNDFVFFHSPITVLMNADNGMEYLYRIDLSTILAISDPLGIPWHPTSHKGQDFTFVFDYFGFTWTPSHLPGDQRRIALPDKKCIKALVKVSSFLMLAHSTVNCKLCMSLHGTLQHITFVYYNGRAYLPCLSSFLSKFTNDYSTLHVLSSVLRHLTWWHAVLLKPSSSRLLSPCWDLDLDIWVDTSTDWGIGLVMAESWAAWRLAPSWKAEGRDIGWAKAIALKLAVLWVTSSNILDAHVVVCSDNTSIIGAFNKGCSCSTPCNDCI